MGTGYTRQAAADILPGDDIEAGPLNAEFNQIQSAFDDVIGHAHDGTVGNAPKLDFTNSITGALDLAAIEALAGLSGDLFKTGANTWALRTLTAPAAGFTITNPAGVAGDPTFVLNHDLAALEGMSSTGLAAHTATDTWIERTIAGTANQISMTNGDGVAGNPTIALSSTAIMPGTLQVTGATILPVTDGATALGSTTKEFSNLFIVASGVLNWNNGAVTLKESSGVAVLQSTDNQKFQSSLNSASTVFQFDNLTRSTVNDQILLEFHLQNSAAAQKEYARITATATNTTSTTEQGNLTFGVSNGGSIASNMLLEPGVLRPVLNDGGALGKSGTAWADLFLASGGVINWNAGNATITHSAAALSVHATSGVTFDGSLFLPVSSTINWNAGDTTLTQSAGTLALAGSSGALFDLSSATAGQIKFPASQNASANANTLDDYKEGTWTPQLQFGGANVGLTTSIAAGVYTKIGNIVVAEFNIIMTAVGSSTGTAIITGLPNALATLTSAGASIGLSSGFSGLTGALALDVNGSTIRLLQSTATGHAQLSNGSFTATTSIRGSVVYITT